MHNEADRHWIVNVLEYVTIKSTAERMKVGAIIVALNGTYVKGFGHNSVPRTSKDQSCEDVDGKTKPDVIHAEAKAIAVAAKDGAALKDCTLYCTIPPCPVCCGLIIEAGIKRVVYQRTYWSESNLHLLTDAGITVSKFEE